MLNNKESSMIFSYITIPYEIKNALNNSSKPFIICPYIKIFTSIRLCPASVQYSLWVSRSTARPAGSAGGTGKMGMDYCLPYSGWMASDGIPYSVAALMCHSNIH